MPEKRNFDAALKQSAQIVVTAFQLVVSALVALAMVARHLRRLGQRRLGQRFLGRHFVVVDAERPFFMGSVVTRTCSAEWNHGLI